MWFDRLTTNGKFLPPPIILSLSKDLSPPALSLSKDLSPPALSPVEGSKGD